MDAKAKMRILQGSTVWVWDSTWLPAVVVGPTRAGFVLVRFEHGVTCSVAMSGLQPHDLTSRDSDKARLERRFRDEPRREYSQQNSRRE
jgi:hypothetical protein